MRGKAGRPTESTTPRSSFWKWTKEELRLEAPRVVDAQRIGALPEPKLEQALKPYRGTGEFLTYRELILYARPFWHQEKRHDRHENIVSKASRAQALEVLGPFALIYLDPPWTFETHTPEMTHRMPDDHYPVLTDDQIVAVTFQGKTIARLAQDDCAMFMWATSSNLKRAIDVMERLGFDYKTHAIWDKEVIGMGLIFRNQHEVLLYGSRGAPPKPIKLHSSIFRHRRGRHSAKPKQVRQALESMYPKFKAANRVELFARGQIAGWTALGHEAADGGEVVRAHRADLAVARLRLVGDQTGSPVAASRNRYRDAAAPEMDREFEEQRHGQSRLVSLRREASGGAATPCARGAADVSARD